MVWPRLLFCVTFIEFYSSIYKHICHTFKEKHVMELVCNCMDGNQIVSDNKKNSTSKIKLPSSSSSVNRDFLKVPFH